MIPSKENLEYLRKEKEFLRSQYEAKKCCKDCSPEYIDGKPSCSCKCHQEE